MPIEADFCHRGTFCTPSQNSSACFDLLQTAAAASGRTSEEACCRPVREQKPTKMRRTSRKRPRGRRGPERLGLISPRLRFR